MVRPAPGVGRQCRRGACRSPVRLPVAPSTLPPLPGAVGPAPRLCRRYAGAPAAALLNRSRGRRMASLPGRADWPVARVAPKPSADMPFLVRAARDDVLRPPTRPRGGQDSAPPSPPSAAGGLPGLPPPDGSVQTRASPARPLRAGDPPPLAPLAPTLPAFATWQGFRTGPEPAFQSRKGPRS